MAKKHLKKETASAVIAAVRRGGGEGAPIGETAYRRIRSDIVFGKLPPGQKLTLDRMKEAYNASVSTLREILNRLSSEALIKAEGAKGFEVMPRRWVVERTFAWLGRCRRLAKDFEATIASAEAWIFIASIRLMLRRMAAPHSA